MDTHPTCLRCVGVVHATLSGFQLAVTSVMTGESFEGRLCGPCTDSLIRWMSPQEAAEVDAMTAEELEALIAG